MRAGAQALSLLSVPLNVEVLTTLEKEPKPLAELRRAVGTPPQTTMRKYLQALTGMGALERQREGGFPGRVEYELTRAGKDLVSVIVVLESWLRGSPDGSIEVGTPASKSAIKALEGGWSSTIIRALAARPLTLTELNRLIKGLNYPSLERRLAAMRFAEQIEPLPGVSRGTPYRVTDWLRRGVAPLVSAAKWEREHLRDRAAPLKGRDAEAVFLLISPTLKLPAGAEGSCRLAMEFGNSISDLAGVTLEVIAGEVRTHSSRLEGPAEARAVGSPSAWLRTLADGIVDELEFSGDVGLARELSDGLHRTLTRPDPANAAIDIVSTPAI